MSDADTGFDPTVVAQRFVAARLERRSLPEYPGPLPSGAEQAYACQDAAIGLYPEAVAGWKVGRIPAPKIAEYGTDRLAGPVFKSAVWPADASGVTRFQVFPGGFAAVEAEFVFRLLEDAPADKLEWTREEAAALPWAVHMGVEIAGSPFAGINDLGPAVTISDFGNNAGVILGPVLDRALDQIACETFIDGTSVGRGVPSGLPGGPLEGVRFLLENAARRGRPLRAGQIVSSGAVTGVHQIRAGQEARLVFEGVGEIRCVAEG
jgi:2-keto-4-pentenoate hydratase